MKWSGRLFHSRVQLPINLCTAVKPVFDPSTGKEPIQCGFASAYPEFSRRFYYGKSRFWMQKGRTETHFRQINIKSCDLKQTRLRSVTHSQMFILTRFSLLCWNFWSTCFEIWCWNLSRKAFLDHQNGFTNSQNSGPILSLGDVNQHIYYKYNVYPLLSPPSQISPLPLISAPPPFQGKKVNKPPVSIKPPSPPLIILHW